MNLNAGKHCVLGRKRQLNHFSGAAKALFAVGHAIGKNECVARQRKKEKDDGELSEEVWHFVAPFGPPLIGYNETSCIVSNAVALRNRFK
jgi:hypothetical protein